MFMKSFCSLTVFKPAAPFCWHSDRVVVERRGHSLSGCVHEDLVMVSQVLDQPPILQVTWQEATTWPAQSPVSG